MDFKTLYKTWERSNAWKIACGAWRITVEAKKVGSNRRPKSYDTYEEIEKLFNKEVVSWDVECYSHNHYVMSIQYN